MSAFDAAWNLLKQDEMPIATDAEYAEFLESEGFYTAPEFREEKFMIKTGKRPPSSINNSAVGGQNTTGSNQQEKMNQAMAMLAQVQANKLSRHQQMIDAGLNPLTGMMNSPQPPQGQYPGYDTSEWKTDPMTGSPFVQPTSQMQPQVPPMMNLPPVQQQPLMQDPSLQPINYNAYPPPPQM